MMFSRFMPWFSRGTAPASLPPHPPLSAPPRTLVPRVVRTLSVDEQVRWAYLHFKPEVASRVARGIRSCAAASASEGAKRPSRVALPLDLRQAA